MNFLAPPDDSGRGNRVVGTVGGLLLTLLGVAGIAVSNGHAVAGVDADPAKTLGAFGTDLLQSVVEIVLGLLVVVAVVAGTRPSRAVNRLAGGVVLLIGAYGIAALTSPLNVFATNDKSNDLLVILGFVLLVPAVLADRQRSRGNGPKYPAVSHDGAGGGAPAGRTPAGGRRRQRSGDDSAPTARR